MNLEHLSREELIELLNQSLEQQALDRAAQQGDSDEQLKLMNELRMYQVELEMQNRELRATQTALELACDRERELHQRFAALDQLNVAVSTILTTAQRASPEAVIGAVAERALALLSPQQTTIRVEPEYANGHAFQVTRLAAPEHRSQQPTVELRTPMRLGGRVQGELIARFSQAHTETHEDLPRTLELVAERVSLALEIARLNQHEAHERTRLDVLERVSRGFASCHDLGSTRRALLAAAALSVPKLARCCVPIVLEGGCWRQLGVAHEDARARRIIEKLARRFEAWLQAGTGRAAELMLCRSSVVFDRLETPGLARLGERLHLESLSVVPMVVSGRLLGWLCFGQGESARAVDRHAALALSDLAAVCAAALERARLVEELRAAVASRDTLLATVSHDLRSPLNAIALTVRSLGPEPLSVERRQTGPQIALIQRTVANMSRLVDDLLAVSTIDAGYFSVQPSAQQPRLLIAEALQLNEPALRAKELVWEQLCGELPEVVADRQRLLQVFTNLIANAVRFSPRGGSLRVSARQSDAAIEFCVADDGPGIPEHQLSQVFVRYWRARGKRSELGLGLYIAKHIVVAHGGRIWAQNTPGRGASFYFVLPVLDTTARAGEPALVCVSAGGDASKRLP